MKICGREDVALDRYWLDPSGNEYYVNGFKGTHMAWIFDNQHVLPPEQKEEIIRLGLEPDTMEKFAGVLYRLGWIRISENVVLMEDDRGMYLLASFLKKHSKDANIDMAKTKKVSVISMKNPPMKKMSVSQILRKYGKSSLQLAASFGKMSSRDAVKDTIRYWDKAKNKDFSKYWRKLRRNKKKKANYIPNPKTTVEQPLKKNYDYGEIPNYVDRLRWFNKKQRTKKRKADLDTI
jgi:hypothetical protein